MIDRILEHMEQAESLIDALWREQRALEAQRDAALALVEKMKPLLPICGKHNYQCECNREFEHYFDELAAIWAEAEREG